jgi:hypothetical protein
MEAHRDAKSHYRIQVYNQVKYVVVEPGIYDNNIEVLYFGPDLLENLPPFPPGNWTLVNVARGKDGTLSYTVSSKVFEGVTNIWHPKVIEVLELKQKGRFDFGVHIV